MTRASVLPNPWYERQLLAFLLLFTLLLALLGLISSPTLAAGEPGIITKKIGKVTLLLEPNPSRVGAGPHVKYDGQYYRSVKAKKGMTVPIGSVIQTTGIGRARVTYPNGDQITVSKASFYRVGFDQKKGKNVGELMFGSIRGLVRNKGKKEKLQVKTRSMVMGVRGTDFYVSARDATGNSVVNVLRGKVAVAQLPPPPPPPKEGEAPKVQKPLKMVEIPAGFSVKVKGVEKAKNGKRKRRAPLKVKPTTKKQLVAVQVESTIKEDPKEAENEEPMSAAVAEKIAELEAKATENCMADIKEYNPTLYAQIKEQGTPPKSVDAIQTKTVKSMIKKAPVAADSQKAKKPTAKELEAIDQNIYDRYFN